MQSGVNERAHQGRSHSSEPRCPPTEVWRRRRAAKGRPPGLHGACPTGQGAAGPRARAPRRRQSRTATTVVGSRPRLPSPLSRLPGRQKRPASTEAQAWSERGRRGGGQEGGRGSDSLVVTALTTPSCARQAAQTTRPGAVSRTCPSSAPARIRASAPLPPGSHAAQRRGRNEPLCPRGRKRARWTVARTSRRSPSTRASLLAAGIASRSSMTTASSSYPPPHM